MFKTQRAQFGVDWEIYTEKYTFLQALRREAEESFEYHLRREGIEDTIYSILSALHMLYSLPRDLITEGILPLRGGANSEGKQFFEDSFNRLKHASTLARKTVEELEERELSHGERLSLLEKRIIESGEIIHSSRKINPFTRYRNVDVSPGLGDLPFTPPDEIPFEMNEYLNALFDIPSPFLRGIYTHFHIVRIHPFVDGNGRVARIWMNAFFAVEGFPPFTIFPLKEEVFTAAQGYLDLNKVRRIREEYRHLMALTRASYLEGNPYYLMPLFDFTVKRIEELIDLFRGTPREVLSFLQKNTYLRK